MKIEASEIHKIYKSANKDLGIVGRLCCEKIWKGATP